VADFGLGEYEQTGLGLLVYVNTARCCAKELALLPRQTCPEHRHPPVSAANPGKEETFRCRWGTVYLYVPGTRTARPHARAPRGREAWYTVWHESRCGRAINIPSHQTPGTGSRPDPAARFVSEFSTQSLDEKDIFTDPEIQRFTKVTA